MEQDALPKKPAEGISEKKSFDLASEAKTLGTADKLTNLDYLDKQWAQVSKDALAAGDTDTAAKDNVLELTDQEMIVGSADMKLETDKTLEPEHATADDLTAELGEVSELSESLDEELFSNSNPDDDKKSTHVAGDLTAELSEASELSESLDEDLKEAPDHLNLADSFVSQRADIINLLLNRPQPVYIEIAALKIDKLELSKLDVKQKISLPVTSDLAAKISIGQQAVAKADLSITNSQTIGLQITEILI